MLYKHAYIISSPCPSERMTQFTVWFNSANFFCMIYIPHLALSIGCDAFINDFQLYRKLYFYRPSAALTVLRRMLQRCQKFTL